MAILPLPPSGVAFIDPITGGVSVQWQNYLLSLSTISGGFAPLNAEYWVSTANSDLTNETNLGALTTGYLKLTVAAGVGTPSTVSTIPASDISGTLGVLHGGTGADLSGTGGTNQVLQQASVGAAVTVGALSGGSVTGAAFTKTDDTNVTATLTGTPTTAVLRAMNLALGWTGTLSVARGGSGAGTFTAHGVLLGESTSAFSVTAAGASNTVLHGNTGADPSFSAVSLTADVSGTLPVGSGGTGATTLASNGVLYGNATGAVQALAVNATATNKFLTQVSSGTPAWNAIIAGDVPNLPASIITSGQLALARGGTNADLSATGGTSQFVRQSSVGAAFTVSQPSCSDLSDYASGTWTASDGSGAGLSITNTYTGQYVRVGNVVYVSMAIVYPATGSGTASLIAGLPFGSIAVQSGMNIFYSSYGDVLYCLINASASTLAFYDKNGGALTNANLSGKTIRASGSYKI